MKPLLFAAMLGVLGTRITGADKAPMEKVLFEEQFTDRLGKEWSWIREDPKAWRIEKGALVLRTSPGYLYARYNDSKNVLLRTLPKTEHFLAVEVHVEGDPKVQYEHAGVVWYVDDDNYVALFQEFLDGKVALQMVTENEGNPRTDVVQHGAEDVSMRLLISAGTITGQYRRSEKEPWRDVGQAQIPAKVHARVGVTAGGAPKEAERYVRFRAFRILEIVRE
jgi:regulation of enolase protein 1 (concanavalin A-like superfamily)